MKPNNTIKYYKQKKPVLKDNTFDFKYMKCL